MDGAGGGGRTTVAQGEERVDDVEQMLLNMALKEQRKERRE